MKITSNVIRVILFFLSLNAAVFAQDMNPDAARLYNEGNEKLKLENFDGAIASYDSALMVEKDYRIYYQKGVAFKKKGALDKAKENFEESVKLKTDFETGYNALGAVYFAIGDMESAIKNFEKVLEVSTKEETKKSINKNLTAAYLKLGNTAFSNKNNAKSIEYLEKAVSYSDLDAAYLSLAKVYSETAQYDKSLAAAENALKFKNTIGTGGPYYYMGIAYKNKGDKTKAKEMFNLAKSDANYKKSVEYELSLLK
jgi:tetratricopeptide (TPR) repeat protein